MKFVVTHPLLTCFQAKFSTATMSFMHLVVHLSPPLPSPPHGAVIAAKEESILVMVEIGWHILMKQLGVPSSFPTTQAHTNHIKGKCNLCLEILSVIESPFTMLKALARLHLLLLSKSPPISSHFRLPVGFFPGMPGNV